MSPITVDRRKMAQLATYELHRIGALLVKIAAADSNLEFRTLGLRVVELSGALCAITAPDGETDEDLRRKVYGLALDP